MQVVSGRLDKPKVHFEAPPREVLEDEMAGFLTWFDASCHDPALDPLLRAGIAHFWFVTLHPFKDGNGRLARALVDRALAQADRQNVRLYTMSAAIWTRARTTTGYLKPASVARRISATGWLGFSISCCGP